ncbi:DUF1345 domain-containing protein [Micromonospora narathiwatensis]|uniref:Uncharacterized membrane protein n=1 Tax=Micromonospora narathiwatensis TaxID=299146 RepID=A0A1A8ZCB7_9ACTN|nr:DUF1345 domain-containing protein [Micromonospora narathiwatensis]SBT41445.1 Uncharacterized membrane protein [Micromonospora narathiwatensis]
MGLVGAVCGGLVGALTSPALGPLVGWDAAALAWLGLVWHRLWRMDAAAAARLARREDPDRAVRDVLLLAAFLVSLLAVGVLPTAGRRMRPGLPLDANRGVGVLSVVVSWFVVHTVFTTRYARLFYGGEPGGVDFHQSEPPCSVDFAYLAFTVGCAFQVSDTNLSSSELRRTCCAVVSVRCGHRGDGGEPARRPGEIATTNRRAPRVTNRDLGRHATPVPAAPRPNRVATARR